MNLMSHIKTAIIIFKATQVDSSVNMENTASKNNQAFLKQSKIK